MILEPAIDRAIRFLTGSRSDNGLWKDFRLFPGESDEWVSGYVGSILCGSGDPQALKCSMDTWSVLGMRRWNGHGGWGYNGKVSEDADSTIWCLALANNLGIGDKLRADLAIGFIRGHITPDQGVSTYRKDYLFQKEVPQSTVGLFRGWIQAHACVTAAVALLEQFNDWLVPFLIMNQREQGNWTGYWWNDDEYATALAVEAIQGSGTAEKRIITGKAAGWIEKKWVLPGFIANRYIKEGSAFATALALRVLLQADPTHHRKDLIESGLQWLTDRQQNDGGWPSSALLRVPPPKFNDPGDFYEWEFEADKKWGTMTFDQNRLFTTATVLKTLIMAHKMVNEQMLWNYPNT
jgi:hypothetical protein